MAHVTTATPPSPTNDLIALDVPIGRICCGRCIELIEQRMRANPQVVQVHVDAAQGVAHVEVRPGKVSLEEPKAVADECCGGRIVATLCRRAGIRG